MNPLPTATLLAGKANLSETKARTEWKFPVEIENAQASVFHTYMQVHKILQLYLSSSLAGQIDCNNCSVIVFTNCMLYGLMYGTVQCSTMLLLLNTRHINVQYTGYIKDVCV